MSVFFRGPGAIVRVAGVLLLLAFVVWVGSELVGRGSERAEPQVLTGVQAFEGNLKLPKETIEHEMEQARDKVEGVYGRSETFRRVAQYADWSAFLLTALITLVGGYLGMPPPAKADTPDVAQLIAGRSQRLGRLIGVLAAAAAIATVASGRAATESERLYTAAKQAQTTIMAVRKAVLEAPDEGTARDQLEQLKLLR